MLAAACAIRRFSAHGASDPPRLEAATGAQLGGADATPMGGE